MNRKIQAAILYPQLDSEQRQNEEEEEEPSSKPIQTLPLPFFKTRRRKRAKRKEKKNLEFENLAAGLRDQTCCTRFTSVCFCFFFKEAAFLMNLDIERTEKNFSKGQVKVIIGVFFSGAGFYTGLGWVGFGLWWLFTCQVAAIHGLLVWKLLYCTREKFANAYIP